MADRIEDFFPIALQDTWKFLERNSGATVTVTYVAKPAGNRKTIELELTGLPAHLNPAFFDRLTLTRAGLELNRIRLTKRTVDINPPLVVTLNPGESNQVAVLFPEGTVPVLNDQPPFAGKVTFEEGEPARRAGEAVPDQAGFNGPSWRTGLPGDRAVPDGAWPYGLPRRHGRHLFRLRAPNLTHAEPRD